MERLRERLAEAEAAGGGGGGEGGGEAGVQLMVVQSQLEVLEQEKERAAREAADRVSSMELKVMALEAELERLGVDPQDLYDDASAAGGAEVEGEEGTEVDFGDETPRSVDRESSVGGGSEDEGEESGALSDLDLDDTAGSGAEVSP